MYASNCCCITALQLLLHLTLLLLPMPLQVLLQCPKLQSLAITGCSQLESLMLWSDEITELDLTGKAMMPQAAAAAAAAAVHHVEHLSHRLLVVRPGGALYLARICSCASIRCCVIESRLMLLLHSCRC
jgi:hypothetical protein